MSRAVAAFICLLVVVLDLGCGSLSENMPNDPGQSYREFLDKEFANLRVVGDYSIYFDDPDSRYLPLIGECEVDVLYPFRKDSEVLLVIHLRMRHLYEEREWRLHDITGKISDCNIEEGTSQRSDEAEYAKRLVGRTILLGNLDELPHGISQLRTHQAINEARGSSDFARVIKEAPNRKQE